MGDGMKTFLLATAILTFSYSAQSAPTSGIDPLSQVSSSAWEYVLIVFLLIGMIGFVAHLLLGVKRTSGPAKVHAGAEAIAPFDGLLVPLTRGAVTAVIGFSAVLRPLLDHTQTGSAMILNDNIGGAGTLVGVYVPVLLTLVSLIWGHFNHSEAAVKEVGIAILVNCLYLTFNLFKALATGLSDFSYVDVLVALLTIDVSTIGISLTMSNKDVLASRWFIGLCQLMQIASLTAMITTIAFFGRRHPRAVLPCTQQIWWTVIDSCRSAGAALWVYFALRCAQWEHRRRYIFQVVPVVDRYKKISEHHKAYQGFYQYSATLLWFYVEEIPLLLVNLCSLLLLLRRLAPAGSSDILEWGQSATLITCVVAFVHWVYAYRAVITRAKAWITDRVLVHLPRPIGLPLHAQKIVLFVLRCFVKARALLFPGMNATPWHTQKRWLAKEMAVATQLGDTQAIEELLSLGASVHHAPDGSSSLNEHAAPDLMALLRDPSLIFDRPDSKTPVVTAIEYGHKHLVQLYLDLGAPLDALDITGKSPLCYAIAARQFDVAHFLLDRLARPYALRLSHNAVLLPRFPSHDEAILISSALHHAVSARSLDLVQRILLHQKETPGIYQARLAFAEDPEGEWCSTDVNAIDSEGRTALSLAMEWGTGEIITELLRRHASPDNYNAYNDPPSVQARNDFDTATGIAVGKESFQSFLKLCLWWSKDWLWLERALQIAVKWGRHPLVDLLLNYPILDRVVAIALPLAPHSSDGRATMKLLSSMAGDADAYRQGKTALYLAVGALNIVTIEILLQLGADPCRVQYEYNSNSEDQRGLPRKSQLLYSWHCGCIRDQVALQTFGTCPKNLLKSADTLLRRC